MSKVTFLFSNPKKAQWFIFALACIIYVNTIPNKWAIDDRIIIHQNAFVKRGVSGIPDIFSKDAFAGFYGKDVNAVSGGRYRPLTPAIFALQAEVLASAKKDKAQEIEKDKAGHKIKDITVDTWFPNILHLFNVMWYGLLCLVLYRTLLLLFHTDHKEVNFKGNFIAIVTTLLYTVHPLHTEAVANVKGLDEIMAMLGAVASLYCVLKVYRLSTKDNVTNQKTKWLIGTMAAYFLGLLSKESAVTFIAIIPLALWFFTQASIKSILKLSIPLFIPLVVFLGIRQAVLYQPNKGAIAEEMMNDPFLVLDPASTYTPLVQNSTIKKLINPNANTFTKMPFNHQLATNFYTWGKYMTLLIVPFPLTVDYYPRHIEIKSFSDVSVIFSVVLHLFLLGWALYNIRKKKIIAFGILFYFITFSIVSNLFFSIGTNMAERFMFMPSLGFCLIVASLLYDMGMKWSRKNSTDGFYKIYFGFGAIILIFSGITINRNFDWKDNLTLFSKDIQVSQNSSKINTDLAGEYIKKAIYIKEEKEKEIKDLTAEQKKAALKETDVERMLLLQNSLPLLNKALEIHPLSNAAWFQMANVQHFLGQMDSHTPNVNLGYLNIALAAYEQAFYYKPAGIDTTIIKFQSLCNMDIGKVMGEKFRDINSAIHFLEKAKTLTPEDAEIYLLLGTAYSMMSDYEKTIAYTLKSLELRPKNRDTKQNLAVAYQQYAYANVSKRNLLPIAEKILLDVLGEEKKLPDTDILKKDGLLRTLDLLIRNYRIQGKLDKVAEYKGELLKVNPNAVF